MTRKVDGDGSSERKPTRRVLLRTAGATAVGITGLTAVSGTAAAGDWKGSSASDASAPWNFPAVTTRGHFDSDGNLINGESTYSYDKRGDFGPIGDEPVVLFVRTPAKRLLG
jgi:hypothetical protein